MGAIHPIKGKIGHLASMSTCVAFLSDASHRFRFVYTPKHSSWLNQIEIWWSYLVRRLLARASWMSVAHLREGILAFITYYNRLSHLCQGSIISAPPTLLARRNVGMDMQYSVYMAGRSDSSRGEKQGLMLSGFFLTVHECDCWKLARETQSCSIESDNITEHFWDIFAELQLIWLLPVIHS